MPRADFTFSFPKRVRFAEVDAQAVVFNSRYLEYFDIGLVEYWRAAGMYEQMGMVGGLEFHVAKALVNFRAPMLVDEVIDICVRCARIGTSSMTVLFELHGAGKDDLRATGEEVHVHVAEVRGRPVPVPQSVIDLFEGFEGRNLREGIAA
jgi:acyl-CoA thioester hydrolase